MKSMHRNNTINKDHTNYSRYHNSRKKIYTKCANNVFVLLCVVEIIASNSPVLVVTCAETMKSSNTNQNLTVVMENNKKNAKNNVYLSESATRTSQNGFDPPEPIEVPGCPEVCTCGQAVAASLNQQLKTLDCSHAKLQISTQQFTNAYHVTKPGITSGGYNIRHPQQQAKVLIPDMGDNIRFVQQVKLSSNDLEELEPGTFSNLTSVLSIDLSDNKLKRLEEYDLVGLANVLSINLTRNLLRVIHQDAFSNTPKLVHLFLSQNFLNYIHSQWFTPIIRLEQLFVAQNGVANIKEKTFSALSSLLTMSLADNHLESLDKAAFLGLTRLEHLDLSGNQLRLVPSRAISLLNNLHDLKLDNNAIQVIGAYAFDSLNLYALSLNSMNSLTAIERDAFLSLSLLYRLEINRNPNLAYISPFAIRDTSHLNSLYLNDNKLIAIPERLINSFPTLETLAVHGNPFKCDCNILWLRNLIEKQLMRTEEGWSNKSSTKQQNSVLEREDDAIDHPLLYNNKHVTVIRIEDILCPIGTQKWLLPHQGGSTTTSAVHIRGQPLQEVPIESIPQKCAPTVIPLFSQTYNLELGNSLNLTCHAIGVPKPAIHWILPNGDVVNSTMSPRPHFKIDQSGHFVLNSIRVSDAGTYTCSATSSQGYATARMRLRIHSKDVHLLFKGVATNFITVTWNNTDATLSTSLYVILYRAPATQKGYYEVPIEPYMRAYTFTSLKPQTAYEFCIAYVKSQHKWHKINCIKTTTKHNMYLMNGIKSVHNVTLIIVICTIAALITLICILVAVCKTYCKRKDYRDPTPWGGDKYFTTVCKTNGNGQTRWIDYSATASTANQIPLEHLYSSPPTTPLASTPLCTSTTSLISNATC